MWRRSSQEKRPLLQSQKAARTSLLVDPGPCREVNPDRMEMTSMVQKRPLTSLAGHRLLKTISGRRIQTRERYICLTCRRRQYVTSDCHEVANGTNQHEHVPDCMMVEHSLTNIENCAQGVREPASCQPRQSF